MQILEKMNCINIIRLLLILLEYNGDWNNYSNILEIVLNDYRVKSPPINEGIRMENICQHTL